MWSTESYISMADKQADRWQAKGAKNWAMAKNGGPAEGWRFQEARRCYDKAADFRARADFARENGWNGVPYPYWDGRDMQKNNTVKYAHTDTGLPDTNSWMSYGDIGSGDEFDGSIGYLAGAAIGALIVMGIHLYKKYYEKEE